DPLDKQNDLANKKRKHAADIHDYFKETKRQDFVTIEDLKDFKNAMLYTVQEIFFRRHQGPRVDDHARTFSSLLLAEVDKRNLNPLKQMRTIKQLRQYCSSKLRYCSSELRYCSNELRPNGDALRKCILKGPYTPFTVIIPVVPATNNSLAVPEQPTVEIILNISPENKAHFKSEKEAIHLILTRIVDEIYSTVDACLTAHEMWEAIERNNLTVDMMQVNVQFLQQLQPEWSRFVTIVKQQHKLDEVSYHKFFDILKQCQKEVNEIRVERIAKNANPLALVAIAQQHQDPYY
ncbi:hypothetical protein Tco_0519934, partial [Tanacetum coccineum]